MIDKHLVLAIMALGGLAATPVLAQKVTETRPPTIRNETGLPNSVTLKTGRASAMVSRLPVLRSYDVGALRARPQVTLGDRPVNLAPMLESPKGLISLSNRLAAMPQQFKVTLNHTQVSEVAQGLVVHQELSYSIQPGQCSNPSARAAIEATGIHCLSHVTLNDRLGEFSRKGSRMYVADAGRRATTMAQYKTFYQQQESQVDQHIAVFRQALADPAKHAAAVARFGADKVARISALTDDQIRDEIGNSATYHIQETVFVPRNPGPQAPSVVAKVGAGQGNGPQAPVTEITDQHLDAIYLTGFTLGNDYEWSEEFDATVDPCALGLAAATDGISVLFGVSGCPITASFTPYAGFNYGFGLRFPIETDLEYQRDVQPNRPVTASVTATYKPIDGSAAQYASTGLDEKKVFNGQELVAQVGADAGLIYDLPVVGSGKVGLSLEEDFTQGLPSPFTGGQFAPPAPGPQGLDGSPIVFDQFDLLGDTADFGVAGAQVFPAIKIGLVSNSLTFDVTDKERGGAVTQVTHSGQKIPLAVDAAHGNKTDFTFGNPVYNLGFRVTPGLDLHMFVDLAVWSDSWDPELWFPQIAIELPPQGANFHCHDGTVCTREYSQSGTQASATQTHSTTQTSGPAKLKAALVHFHQDGDGKDWDTEVDLMIKDGNGGIVAASHLGKHTDFGDNTMTQDYAIAVQRPILKSDLLKTGSFDMIIHPNGHDHWNYTAYVTLQWDDGTSSGGHVSNWVDQNMTGRTAKFAQGFIP